MLMQVFLRGGADGLHLVAPVDDPTYRRLRPGLSAELAGGTPLGDGFVLHPALSALAPLYAAGTLAVLHATGTDDATRSHFAAQDRLEHGTTPGAGWLGHLARSLGGGGLRAVALGHALPESLRGAPGVSVFEDAASQRLDVDAAFTEALGALWHGEAPLLRAGRDALGTLARLRDLPELATEVALPEHPFGRRLRELLRVLRGGLTPQVVALDVDGWDTHFVQAEVFAGPARALAEGLAAFWSALDPPRRAETTILVVSEFGRRVAENGSLGTDHGRGGVALALGAGVRGGRVLGDWPGLERLEGPGDLPVTVDVRRLLAEAVEARFPQVDVEAVLPGVRGPSGAFT
jgi:uncharacterized protein (DUF1501 family)